MSPPATPQAHTSQVALDFASQVHVRRRLRDSIDSANLDGERDPGQIAILKDFH